MGLGWQCLLWHTLNCWEEAFNLSLLSSACEYACVVCYLLHSLSLVIASWLHWASCSAALSCSPASGGLVLTCSPASGGLVLSCSPASGGLVLSCSSASGGQVLSCSSVSGGLVLSCSRRVTITNNFVNDIFNLLQTGRRLLQYTASNASENSRPCSPTPWCNNCFRASKFLWGLAQALAYKTDQML